MENQPSQQRRRTPGMQVSIAPMMAWTTPEQRFFMRGISRCALLYTEMVNTGALLHGDTQRFLTKHNQENPVALQLGGSDPAQLAACAKLAEDAGFDEVNINVGCPSERVKKGAFGACLMAEPELIADAVAKMRAAVDIPVTVKTRIGIDHQDNYEFLYHFTESVNQAGVDALIVHARKAWLSGLSPKENREIPPLDYPRVYQLAEDFPNLPMSINGGIKTLADIQAHLRYVDGVMIGREAYKNPYFMAAIDSVIFNQTGELPSRQAVVEAMQGYVEQYIAQGGQLKNITRHMLGLFHGQPGGRLWRRALSERAHYDDANWSVIAEALQTVLQTAKQALAS